MGKVTVEDILSGKVIDKNIVTDKAYFMCITEAVILVGEVVKQLKKKRIKPDYVVLIGTEAFVLNIPVVKMMEKILGVSPTLLTPIINRFFMEKSRKELEFQLEKLKADKKATYLIFDTTASSGTTSYFAKTLLEELLDEDATVYTAVLMCNQRIRENTEKAGRNPVPAGTVFKMKFPVPRKADSYYYLPDFVGEYTDLIPDTLWRRSEWVGLRKDEHQTEEDLFSFRINSEKRKNREETMRKLTENYLRKEMD